jgi:L-iditol 2-dehydrogenase
VFITGAGPIGAVAALSARAAGATDIIVSDPVESRRKRITELASAQAIDSTTGFDPTGLDADVFLECSGATSALLDGLKAVAAPPSWWAKGDEHISLPVQDIQVREVTLTGIFRYVDTWPTAISLAATGRVDLDALVTARFGLDEVEAALTSDDDPMSMKSIVVVNEKN